MFKKAKIATALSLAILMLAALFSVSAFNPSTAPGTLANPRQAGITKELRTPAGTYIPAAMAFNFTVTPLALNGIPVGDATFPTGITIPALGNQPAGSNAVRLTGAAGITPTTAGGIDTRIFDTGNLLAGITWPTTGIFEWTVVEETNVAPHTPVQNDPGLWEVVTYSPTQYTLRVHIAEDADTGTRFVRFAYAVRTVDVDGDPIDPEDQDKYDPTPGEGGARQMRFINQYTRDNRNSTDPTVGPLDFTKTVTGSTGSTTREFAFSATLYLGEEFAIAPATVPGPFVANRIAADGTTVLGTVTFTNNNAATFNLRHGERLVFNSAPVGTQFTVTETAVFGYTTSIIVNSQAGTGTTTINPGLTTGALSDHMVREATAGISRAAFTNDNDTPPPTGLILNNLPFIGLILIALGGFASFIVVSARKRKNYNNY